MNKNDRKINVLMCGSKLTVKGGMVSVIKNYLSYEDWEKYNIIYVPTHIDGNALKKTIYFLFSYIKIFNLCLFKHIKIAHFHVSEKGSFYRKALLLRLCSAFRIKTILHHHGAEFSEFYLRSNNKKKRYIRAILEKASMNVVLSNKSKTELLKINNSIKVETLYNSIRVLNENPYSLSSKIILFLGRLGNRKGVYDLIEAIERVDKILPKDIEFFLCGDGEIEKVNQIIISKNLNKRVTKVGWINENERKKILYKTMLNVLPSYNEGLPMTILETMSYGIPNITTNIVSIPEVIENGVNGILISPGNVEELIENITVLCFDIEKRKKISNQAFKTCKSKFDFENNMKELKRIYDNIK